TIREGIFEGAALLLDHWDTLLVADHRPLLAAVWERLAAYPMPVFICGEQDWEPPEPLNDRRLLRTRFELPGFDYRRELWASAVRSIDAIIDENDISGLANKSRFGAARIARAAQTAADIAASSSRFPDIHDIY